MPRPKQDIERKTLNLRAGDWDSLQRFFPNSKPSEVVRRLVSALVDKNYREKTEKLDADIQIPLDGE